MPKEKYRSSEVIMVGKASAGSSDFVRRGVRCHLASGAGFSSSWLVHRLREVTRIHSDNFSLRADDVHCGNGVNVVGSCRVDIDPDVVGFVPPLRLQVLAGYICAFVNAGGN